MKSPNRVPVRVGMGSCGRAAGADAVWASIVERFNQRGVAADLRPTGCLGLCHHEVLVEVGGQLYGNVVPEVAAQIVDAHVDGRVLEANALPPFDPKDRVVLRNCGRIDPTSLNDYLAEGGFKGLERARSMDPKEVVDLVLQSGLRGRGGGGFSTGKKWQLASDSSDPVRYVICNADEGDPGAFMDRNLIEGDPFSIIEGLAIAGWALGAASAFIYVRHEYPLATERIAHAIEVSRVDGYLTGMEIEVRRGAGAFVCGEETAMIASLEGYRGVPVLRPPYPTERGLGGHPTCINNVETLANIPWILIHGAEAFRARGTKQSPGTKVFCLAGDVRNTGMVEVSMGASVRHVVEDLGGGVREGRTVKAVQIGGPSGGCLPSSLLDTSVDFEALLAAGSMMGSGGMVVLDDSRCIVDLSRYFMRFMEDESCGKCPACSEGTARMAEILDRICEGRGEAADIELLEDLSGHVSSMSICGLGRSAPNSVLTMLRYFRAELEAHVFEGRCPARTCTALLRYQIDAPKCDGCSVCLRACPVEAIHSDRTKISVEIDDATCVRCGACEQVCPFDAVLVTDRAGVSG